MTEDDLRAIEARCEIVTDHVSAPVMLEFLHRAKTDIPALTAALREARAENELLRVMAVQQQKAIEAVEKTETVLRGECAMNGNCFLTEKSLDALHEIQKDLVEP